MTEIEQERERYEARLKAQRDARWLARQPELARQEGLERGECIGPVRSCQRHLGRPVTSNRELLDMPLEALKRLAKQLEAEDCGSEPPQT